jgi:hypothetical protein
MTSCSGINMLCLWCMCMLRIDFVNKSRKKSVSCWSLLRKRQAMYPNCNIRTRSSNHYSSGKAITITYSECVFLAIVIQHPKRMRHIFICDLSRLYNIFPHYLINGTIFEKQLLNLKCVFWFPLQLFSETFLILRRIQRDIIINILRSSCEVPGYSCPSSTKNEFSQQTFEKYSNIQM